MKRFFKIILTVLLFIPFFVHAQTDKLNVYLFYGSGCPHCKELEEYLEGYLKENDFIEMHRYEVWDNQENAQKLAEIAEIFGTKKVGIPYLIIGNTVIMGYDSEYTPERIKNAVKYYSNVSYVDKAGIYLGVVEEQPEETEDNELKETDIVIPILGKKNIKEVSIFLASVVIGLVDGFNPCAMWILIFLISMLLGISDKKRRYALGISFLVASGLVYFLFLVSWLSLATFLNKIIYIRVGIACIAIIFGFVSVLKFVSGLKKDDGCEVVDTKNRKRIITAIKKIVKEKSFVLALLGIILLAFSVNIIELLCSLGLPVMFSEILTINNLSTASKIMYSLIYIFFFLIDDIIVFIIAMKTLEIKAVSNKFGKYSHLIGGIIMIIIGILMVYKPEWLMFNF